MAKTPLRALRENHAASPRAVMMLAGIALFVAGFLVTVASISENDASGTEVARGHGLLLLSGIALSMAGVVAATAGPASYFVHGTKDDD